MTGTTWACRLRSLASLLPAAPEGGCARRHSMSARPLWYRSLRSTYPTGSGGSPAAPMAAALLLAVSLPVLAESGTLGHFVPGRDLYLPQFDSKTDVDDLHSVAAVATMIRDPRFSSVDYHAVAGAYGIQEGLYVPSPELFEKSFGDHWSDAHNNREQALAQVVGLVAETLVKGGNVWVTEAGQSDFTAHWLARIRERFPEIDMKERIHVVQHSDWNESVTDPRKLEFVKAIARYHKIPDGNAEGNGTPGFNSPSAHLWGSVLATENTGEIWRVARDLANKYNGSEDRYLNESIAAGGMDFSDTAESCWVFGFTHLADADAFFAEFLFPE